MHFLHFCTSFIVMFTNHTLTLFPENQAGYFLEGKKQINSGMHKLFYSQGPCGFPLADRGKGYYGGITGEAPVDVIVTRFLSH